VRWITLAPYDARATPLESRHRRTARRTMCNLYDLDVTPAFLKTRFRLKRADLEPADAAPGLVRPSMLAPVIHLDEDGDPVCSPMEWGFLRQWKSPSGRLTLNRLFNVRSETIDEKPTFAAAYRKTRAIIPVSAYYELPQKGVRIRIGRESGDVLALAGLWEHAVNPKTGAPMTAFTMAMTGSNPFGAAFHDRMPCVLDDHAFKAWLDPSRYDAKKFLVPYVHDDLVAEREASTVKDAAVPETTHPVDGELF
jgi:putative SOS response-associated peptidase YedK